jgi:hypothetical protein
MTPHTNESGRAVNNVGPHPFVPLTWRDRWLKRGRCGACHVARCRHDAAEHAWLPARPLGDRSRPSLPEVHRGS